MKKTFKKFKNHTPKSQIQFLVIAGIIIAAVIFSFFLKRDQQDFQTKGSKENVLLVEVVDVQPEALAIEINKTGTVEARNTISIMPEVSGRITEVNPVFKAGNNFSAKTILFQIEKADYKLRVDTATANLKRAETDLLLTKAEAMSAVTEWKSLNPNTKAPDLVAKVPQLEQAEANFKSAEAELKDAELDLQRTSFSFPYSGKIITAGIEVGQFVQTGKEYGEVYSTEALEIVVPIEKEYLRYFESGKSKAEFEINDQTYTGLIERSSANLDAQTRFSKFYIQPELKNKGEVLPGTFINVRLLGSKQDNLWKIPNEAIQDARRVWIVTEANKLKEYEPKILSIGENYTIAKGNGKAVKLVVSMLVGAANGMSVNYEQ